MRTSLWWIIVVVTAWVGFLLGYAAASHTGMKGRSTEAPAATAAPAAGGYGR